MSSVIWYLYEFARKSWAKKFADAKTDQEIMETPSRFRDFPEVRKEYCIACGACTAACPAPMAIKLVRTKDNTYEKGITYPIINNRGCIRCGFCAEVCPTEPKTLLCGENHHIREKFTIFPQEKLYVIDDYLCIRCKKCLETCKNVAGAISEVDKKMVIDQSKCIGCGDCVKNCPVKGAVKAIYVDHVEEQKSIINLVVNTLESRIEEDRDEIMFLEPPKVYKIDYPTYELVQKAREIIPQEDLIRDSFEKITDRLKLRILTWNEEKCTDCRLCVSECPSGAITYDEEEGVKRDPDKCLRCSICYQTCPFDVPGYYVARFQLTDDPLDEGLIQITIKPSQLPTQ